MDDQNSPEDSKPIIQRKRISHYAQQEIVNIVVGPDRTCFKLHKDLLCDKSAYFQARLKDCWDGNKAEIELQSIDVTHFEIIVDWLYTGRIPDHLMVSREENGPPLWLIIEPLYKTADTLMLAELQNHIVDLDLADSKKRPSCSWSFKSLAKHYELELTHTPFYRLVLKDSVKDFVKNPREEQDFEEVLSTLSNYPQAPIDILRAVNTFHVNPWLPTLQEDKCEFHIHSDGQKCDAS